MLIIITAESNKDKMFFCEKPSLLIPYTNYQSQEPGKNIDIYR